MSETTRRTVLAGAAGISAAAALAACGDDTPQEGADDVAGAASDAASAAAGATSKAGEVAGGALAAVADVPVGGAKILPDQKVVLTQPTPGDIKAFSAVCTHQSCLVSAVEGDAVLCKCHNSRFKISDGSPAGGPATKPLPSVTVKVQDGKITLG